MEIQSNGCPYQENFCDPKYKISSSRYACYNDYKTCSKYKDLSTKLEKFKEKNQIKMFQEV